MKSARIPGLQAGEYVKTAEALPIPVRLKRGAQVLGALWRSKQRCSTGWGIHGNDAMLILCQCEKPTRFCTAKNQWVALALCERDPVYGECGLALMMTASEWDETGLLLKDQALSADIGIGKQGQMKMVDLAAIASDPESGKKMLGLLKAFPGSKVQAVTA